MYVYVCVFAYTYIHACIIGMYVLLPSLQYIDVHTYNIHSASEFGRQVVILFLQSPLLSSVVNKSLYKLHKLA